MTSKIISWNVNGLRAVAKKGFADWLANTPADIIGLQETRATHEQLPAKILTPEGWHTPRHPAKSPGFGGVDCYAQLPFNPIEPGLNSQDHDAEEPTRRVRIAAWCILNGYFPNAQGKDGDTSAC